MPPEMPGTSSAVPMRPPRTALSTTEPAFSGVGSNAGGRALGVAWLSLVGLSVTANIVASRRLDVCSGGWSVLGCQDIDRTL